MGGKMEKIIVLFKTHLDIGFTDLSANVLEQYNKKYIPNALSVGEKLRSLNRSEGFTWTTGSWLIYQYLKQATKEEYNRMSEGIKNGIISWHGLPFTLHSEYASKELYNYGLSLSRKLDREFNVSTIGAKNTDVPGHTCGIIPILAKNNVKFLHIGVNPASAAPEVPDLFHWVAETGESVIVMYNKVDYGEFTKIPYTDTGICFAHTGDNKGPQSVEEIIKVYDDLHEKYPDAIIQSGNLNDVAMEVMKIADKLPIVKSEIGDTWIHGASTDPKKSSIYRSLLRISKDWDSKVQELLYEKLLLIPEHTWGLDEKTHLRDHINYNRSSFESVRNQSNYLKMEQSWEEQRNYIEDAISELPALEKSQAMQSVSEYQMELPDFTKYCLQETNSFILNDWNIEIGKHGSITSLCKGDVVVADPLHELGLFVYEVFSEKEVKEYIERYNRLPEEEWALEDFGKIGLADQMDKYHKFIPNCDAIYKNDEEICVLLSIDRMANEQFGCPSRMLMKIKPSETKVELDFAWFDKPANRIPESCSLRFNPVKPLTFIEKLGMYVDPKNVVSNGNREMHATSGSIVFEDLEITTWDAPVVAIDTTGIYGFYNQIPDMDKGIYINLFNNQWGTNFPMWNSGNARFRFTISVPKQI